jgi:tetratricopeptide (TPR) repeat protein
VTARAATIDDLEEARAALRGGRRPEGVAPSSERAPTNVRGIRRCSSGAARAAREAAAAAELGPDEVRSCLSKADALFAELGERWGDPRGEESRLLVARGRHRLLGDRAALGDRRAPRERHRRGGARHGPRLRATGLRPTRGNRGILPQAESDLERALAADPEDPRIIEDLLVRPCPEGGSLAAPRQGGLWGGRKSLRRAWLTPPARLPLNIPSFDPDGIARSRWTASSWHARRAESLADMAPSHRSRYHRDGPRKALALRAHGRYRARGVRFCLPGLLDRRQHGPVAAAEQPSAPATFNAAPSQDAGFKAVQDERALATQKNDTLVKAYLDAARAAMQAQDYKRAEESVLQALQLRPQDPEGTELFKQVMGLQGVGLGLLEDTVAMVQNRRQLARQQQVLLVKDAYTKATHAEAQGELEAARIELEQAQLMVRYDAYETDFGALKADVDALLSDVRAKLDAKKKAAETDELRTAFDKLREQEAAQRAREEETIRNLLVAAIESFQRGQFDNAESQAKRVLTMQPGNTKAKELVEMAQQSRHLQWNDNNYRRRREETDRWMVEIRAAQIPMTDVLTWASHDEWEKISRRSKRGDFVDRALEANDSDAIRAIRAKLDNDTVNWDFGDAPQSFKEVVKLLRTANGINVVVDPEVANEKNEEQVTVTLRDYKLGGALRILLDGMKLNYMLRDDVLYITTAEKAMGKPIPRVYEVRDLTVSLPHFKAPMLQLRPGAAGRSRSQGGRR